MSTSAAISSKVLFATLESDVLAQIQDPTLKKRIKVIFANHTKDLDSPRFAMVTVQSSTLKAVGYNRDQILRIEFKTGSIYDFMKVSLSEYTNLISAPSVGKYFATQIKPNYGTVKIKD